MSSSSGSPCRALYSTVTGDGRVRLTIETTDVPVPGDDEVTIQVDATPVNPSDLGLLLAGADPASAAVDEEGALSLTASPTALAASAARIDRPQRTGNEGAGVVVATGSSPAARALDGRLVAVLAGGMYATHRVAPATQCLVLPDGTEPRLGASCFVNPLTALGMTETMRREDHPALVHTAAASNLGQMLNRICLADGIGLVNIVRHPNQVALLRSQGATHVVDSSAPTFVDDLVESLIDTGATLAFDAVGGGEGASTILAAMETAANRTSPGEYNRYGSATHKQVYLYGGLDRSPTVLRRTFGMAWAVGGWLLPPFLAQVGPERTDQLRQRVVDELATTFASTYTTTLTLDQLLEPARIQECARMATGEKALVTPNL